ncbi:MAG TPA: ABC transporter substrate-binding protein [Actinomycetes bacterium]|nr:ABC transporter substrate-binding protein [Actinomycetes bacterium]
MTGPVSRVRLAALAAILSLTAACGGMVNTGTDSSVPREGGTLEVIGSGDIDHLDPASAYYVPTWRLLRAITRQLVTYPYSADPAVSTTPVPDLAVSIPEPTDGGTTYTFRIREGASWDASDGPRQITADDVVRGFERLCNPVWPNPAPGYFIATIEGFAKYCQNMLKIDPPTTAAIKDYIDQNEISGVHAVDDLTVEFNLLRPASDFLNILALNFTAPMPVESLKYEPDSPEFRKNFISSGPYKIERYLANQSITLVRNESWDPDSDPVRKAYVDRIEVIMGSDEGPVQKQMEAGTADLAWDTEVPVSDLHRLRSMQDPGLTIEPDGSIQYLVMNLRRAPLNNEEVRKAINVAIDKTAIVKIMGGPTVAEPINRILPPQIAGGQLPVESPYATDGDKGDPETAKQMLAEAGISDLTLTLPFRNAGKAPSMAQAIQQDLRQAGIKVELVPTLPNLFYTSYLFEPSADWDIAVPGWLPDWYGNAGRSFFVPLLDGRTCGANSSNFGCYDNENTNKLIDKALEAPSEDEAAQIWAEADQQATDDAPWVPLITIKTPKFHSDRVQNYLISLGTSGVDYTNIWLSED